jgi:hypothetical protein
VDATGAVAPRASAKSLTGIRYRSRLCMTPAATRLVSGSLNRVSKSLCVFANPNVPRHDHN